METKQKTFLCSKLDFGSGIDKKYKSALMFGQPVMNNQQKLISYKCKYFINMSYFYAS